MRKELYLDICERLKAIGEGEIKHIDLWNQNVEFIEQDTPWERPAVFVEICPITWSQIVGSRTMRGSALLKLHIVTDWTGSAAEGSADQEQALEMLDYSKEIQKALEGMSGKGYDSLALTETHTNHNHEELVESIEVYRFKCSRTI